VSWVDHLPHTVVELCSNLSLVYRLPWNSVYLVYHRPPCNSMSLVYHRPHTVVELCGNLSLVYRLPWNSVYLVYHRPPCNSVYLVYHRPHTVNHTPWWSCAATCPWSTAYHLELCVLSLPQTTHREPHTVMVELCSNLSFVYRLPWNSVYLVYHRPSWISVSLVYHRPHTVSHKP